MDTIIKSFYTDRQVFLRDAGALEKVRFHSVQDESFLGDTKDLEVKLEHNAYAKTITIIDTDVGITKGSEVKNQTTS